MSPILVRPVREQLEHDRLIRFLVLKYEKEFDVIANVGDTQPAPVKLSGPSALFPDLVLLSDGKIAGLVEVETGESTNNLEAMAQWQHFSRARVPFHLYVPTIMLDAALRFCRAYNIGVTEIWTYRSKFDGFDLVRAVHNPTAVAKTPKSTSVVAKLLPPVTPVAVEPEKDAKLAELTSLVELANRTFRVAAGKTQAAAAAAKAAAAAARAAAKAERAAAKAAAKAEAAPPAAPAAEVGSAPRGGARKTNKTKAKSQPASAPAPKKAVKPKKLPKATKPKKLPKAAKPKKATKATKAAKAAKPAAKRAKPAQKVVAKAAKRPKPIKKSATKPVKRKASPKPKPTPKSKPSAKRKSVAAPKPKKAGRKR